MPPIKKRNIGQLAGGIISLPYNASVKRYFYERKNL